MHRHHARDSVTLFARGLLPRPWRISAALAAALLLGACSDAPRAAPADIAATEAGAQDPQPVWSTLIEQQLSTRRGTPEPFRATADTLRVITTMGEAITPLSPGVVIANILPENSPVPVASVHVTQPRPDSLSADTTLVAVPPGGLQLFIAQHRGLRDWRVTVQQRSREPL